MLGPSGPLVNLGKERKGGGFNFKLWHRDDEVAPPEVQWAATGLSTGPADQLDLNSGSKAEGQSPVVRWSGNTPDRQPDLDPPPKLHEEPPEGGIRC